MIYKALKQLDLPGKSCRNGGSVIQLRVTRGSPISHSLELLGFEATCNHGVTTISIQKPPLCEPKSRRKQVDSAPDVSIVTVCQKAIGAPHLITSTRGRPFQETVSQPKRVASSQAISSIISRLAVPRRHHAPVGHLEDDSPRVGFRVTILRRSSEEQQIYMERLSVPRTIYSEPVNDRTGLVRCITQDHLLRLVARLSKPRTLESLVDRYTTQEVDSISTMDSVIHDASMTEIFPMGNLTKVSISPYRKELANAVDGKHREVVDLQLQSEVKFLSDNILNIVTKGEQDFPGLVDSFTARLLEVTVLPSLENRPLSREVTHFDLTTSIETARFLALIALFPPNKLLVCRLRSLIDSLIKHILALHKR